MVSSEDWERQRSTCCCNKCWRKDDWNVVSKRSRLWEVERLWSRNGWPYMCLKGLRKVGSWGSILNLGKARGRSLGQGWCSFKMSFCEMCLEGESCGK